MNKITLSPELLQSFKQIALEDYGQNYTDEELLEQATKAVQLAQLMENLELLEYQPQKAENTTNG